MKQIIHWAEGFNAINGTQFQGLFGDYAIINGATLEPVAGAPWSVTGTFSNLKVNRTTAPGVGRSVTLTLVKNGTATALTTTITHPAIAGQDTTNTVSAAPGDTFSIQYTNAGGAPAQSEGAINLEFDSSDDNESGYSSSPPMLIQTAGPFYHGICCQPLLSLTTNYPWSPVNDYENDTIIPLAGSITRIDFAFRTGTGLGGSVADMAAGDTITFVVLKNGIVQDGTSGTVNTTSTLAFPGTAVSWTGTLTTAPGDNVKLRATPSAGMIDPSSVRYAFLWSIRFDSTTQHRFWLGSNTRTTQIAAVKYAPVAGFIFPRTSETEAQGYGSVTTWYMLSPLQAIAPTGAIYLTVDGRLNNTSPAGAPSVSFAIRPDPFAGSLYDIFQIIAVGSANSPGGSFMTITSADTWNLRQQVSAQTGTSTVFGINTTIAGATNAMAIGLDGATHVITESNKLTLKGNFDTSGYVEVRAMTAPAVGIGARIYVDTADGDLKVIFPNGQVRTIDVN